MKFRWSFAIACSIPPANCTIRFPTKRPRPWIPEFFGDTILVNGKILPYLKVEPRKYRFRLLNASNARFFYLSLSNGAPLAQIGTDQGLLAAPVSIAEAADLARPSAPT